MEGLLRRLSEGGESGRDALRVVSFFDKLQQFRAGIDELVRSTAMLIGTEAGFAGPGGGCGFDSLGRARPQDPPAGAISTGIGGGTADAGLVWVVPASSDADMAQLILERMSLTAATILIRQADAARLGDGEPLRMLIEALPSITEHREEALRRLGFRPDWRVRVVLARGSGGPLSDPRTWREWCGPENRCTAPVRFGTVHAVLVHGSGTLPGALPKGAETVAVGASASALSPRDSYLSALRTLRLCSPTLGPRALAHDALGSLRCLARVGPEEAAGSELVQRMQLLVRTPVGLGEILALDAYCRHANVRAAAAELLLHHSSLGHRLKNVGAKLGIDVFDAAQRNDVWLALQLLRIAEAEPDEA
ncbi:helix-turn-helix domain-containing protein [Rathayibacter sp. VKM Ac-2835]|uniref:helix-turn-helix domain-containing protein n=1 Tax=Rathayibacter sp. VKM Ac-2835 TaxID=2739043 RepID=UPI0015648669|nr:helix-turn-helix domain-containing protein [Rathayibacter sp. VKM Ac-2835]